MQLYSFAASDEYTFDPKTGRYRYTSGAAKGKFAPREAVLALTQKAIAANTAELQQLGDRLAAGTLKLRDFQEEAGAIVRRIHVQNAILGRGGIDKMKPADWLLVARTLKQQFYAGKDAETGRRFGLKHLAAEIKAGEVSAAQLRQRLALYAESGKVTYWEMAKRSAADGGQGYGLRRLGDAQHCPSCVRYAAEPPRPIAELVTPGTRCECRSRCKCSIEFLTLEQAVAKGARV